MQEMEQSRRDDLESVAYVIMYLIRGNLPWQGLKLKTGEDRYKKILEKKKEISSEKLCSNCPLPFFEYVNYSKRLKYDEEPKYEIFKMKFVNFVVNISNEKFDYVFDWTTDEEIKKRKEEFNLTCPPLNYGDGNNILKLDHEINSNEEKADDNEENEKNDESDDEDKKETNKKEATRKETAKKKTTQKGNTEDENEKVDKELEKAATGCCIM